MPDTCAHHHACCCRKQQGLISITRCANEAGHPAAAALTRRRPWIKAASPAAAVPAAVGPAGDPLVLGKANTAAQFTSLLGLQSLVLIDQASGQELGRLEDWSKSSPAGHPEKVPPGGAAATGLYAAGGGVPGVLLPAGSAAPQLISSSAAGMLAGDAAGGAAASVQLVSGPDQAALQQQQQQQQEEEEDAAEEGKGELQGVLTQGQVKEQPTTLLAGSSSSNSSSRRMSNRGRRLPATATCSSRQHHRTTSDQRPQPAAAAARDTSRLELQYHGRSPMVAGRVLPGHPAARSAADPQLSLTDQFFVPGCDKGSGPYCP